MAMAVAAALKEQQTLSKCEATDFSISHLLGHGQHGIVYAAKCTKTDIQDKKKLYAVKLLFNFSSDYSSILSNMYENEWLILSRLLPHPHIIRYWCQFISHIPQEFIQYLPQEIIKSINNKSRATYSKGQFIILDCHERTLQELLVSKPLLEFNSLLKFSTQIIDAIHYLECHQICHLDLKLSNLLISNDSKNIILCDFGNAVKFPDSSLTLQWCQGMSIGGNRAHLCPEVISQYYTYKGSGCQSKLDYIGQPAFAAGVLLHELATCGNHPLEDYPLNYLKDGLVSYTDSDISIISDTYPQEFSTLLKSLLCYDPSKRATLTSALQILQGYTETSKLMSTADQDLVSKLASVTQEKDLAQSQLATLAMERDFALKEMKAMANQCQTVAEEFELLATQCERLKEQLTKVKSERDTAIQASEGSFEAYELLHKELELIVRERDLARDQVDQLRQLCLKVQTKEEMKECNNCQQFYLIKENTDEVCLWHPGVSYNVLSF